MNKKCRSALHDFQRINSFLSQLVQLPALLPFPVAFHNPRAGHLARPLAMSIRPSPETHLRHAWRLRGRGRRSCQLLALFSGIAFTFALARKICFGDYTTVRRRASIGPSGEGRKGPLLLTAAAWASSSGVLRAAWLSRGRSWAHSGAVRAPCGGLDQVRGGHEKRWAGQAGGEDRRLRGGRRWWSEGRGGDGVRGWILFFVTESFGLAFGWANFPTSSDFAL